MIKIFRKVAFLEGCSYLVLFANMLVMKRVAFDLYHQILFPLGMTHGVLFVSYVVLAFVIKKPMQWDWKTFGGVQLASLIPFGTFYIEKKYFEHA